MGRLEGNWAWEVRGLNEPKKSWPTDRYPDRGPAELWTSPGDGTWVTPPNLGSQAASPPTSVPSRKSRHVPKACVDWGGVHVLL